MILNYPTNPTGVEYSEDEIRALAKVIEENHLYVITDEIYSTLTYGVKHFSIASLIPERAIYISGLSKSHAMTGYRLGYVAGPAKLWQKLVKFMVLWSRLRRIHHKLPQLKHLSMG